MTIAKPIAKPLLGLLILAGLMLYAAISVRDVLAPAGASITITQKSETQTPANIGSGRIQAAPSSTEVGAQPAGAETPVNSAGRPGAGVSRFADAGPDVVGQSQSQTVESCGPKPCERPQR